MGIVVLIVAVVALRNPKSDGPKNAGQSVAVSDSVAPRTSASPSPSPSPSRRGSTSAPPVNLGGASSSASAEAAAKSVPLIVLNNTTVSGLARTAAGRFESAGWTVTSSGNYTNDILSTCAYYDPDVSGAQAAAQALQAEFPAIKRVQPRFAELPSGPVVVVLTPDYQSG